MLFRSYRSERLALLWYPEQQPEAREKIKQDAATKSRYAAANRDKRLVLVEVVEMRTGNPAGKILVEEGAGGFYLQDVEVSGDYVLLADNQNRTLVYSLKSGMELGKVFGNHATMSLQSVLVENAPGQVTLYALPKLEKRDELSFSTPLAYATFSPDGKRLLVLTQDQTVYVLDTGGDAGTHQ